MLLHLHPKFPTRQSFSAGSAPPAGSQVTPEPAESCPNQLNCPKLNKLSQGMLLHHRRCEGCGEGALSPGSSKGNWSREGIRDQMLCFSSLSLKPLAERQKSFHVTDDHRDLRNDSFHTFCTSHTLLLLFFSWSCWQAANNSHKGQVDALPNLQVRA